MREVAIATLKTGGGQIASLFCAAISVKVLAVIVGPAGVGLFSLLRQAQQMLTSIASIGGQNAVIQGIASRQGTDQERFKTSIFWVFVCGIIVVSLTTLIFARPLTKFLLGHAQVDFSQWIVLPMAAGAMLIFFRGLLNAHLEFGTVAWINIATSFGALLCAVPAGFLYNSGHPEALIFMLTASLGFGLALAIYQAMARDYVAGLLPASSRMIEGAAVRDFMKVALPSLIATFIGTGSVLFVRAMIVRWHGLPAAGYYDAAWAISVTYLTPLLLALQSYLLPAASGGKNRVELQHVLNNTLHLSAIAAVPLITSFILLKPMVVRVLYSGEFMQALALLRWTLIGDYIRVGGWVLATFLIARADMRAYLVREVAWNIAFVVMALWLVPGAIEWAGPPYVAAYSAYLALLLWRVCRLHLMVIKTRAILQLSIGACIILLASIITWNDTSVSLLKTSLIIPAVAYGWLIMTPAQRTFLLDVTKRRISRLRASITRSPGTRKL